MSRPTPLLAYNHRIVIRKHLCYTWPKIRPYHEITEFFLAPSRALTRLPNTHDQPTGIDHNTEHETRLSAQVHAFPAARSRSVLPSRGVSARPAGLRFVLLMMVLSLGILGCSIGGATSLLPRAATTTPASPNPTSGPTRVLLSTFTPTPYVPPTPVPTNTSPPTETPTITPTASATPTATPPPQVEALQVNIVVREGPGTDYPIIGRIQPDETYPIIGRNDASDPNEAWYQICCVNGRRGWVKATSVLVTGDPSGAPVQQTGPPPTPTPPWTPTPTPTLTPTPSPLFYRGIGPQFYATNNPYLKVWVKVEFANGDPMPGYQLMVFRREGVDRPGGAPPLWTPTPTPTPTGGWTPAPTAAPTATPDLARAPWVNMSTGTLSRSEFMWSQPPGFGDRQAFNLEFTQYPDPGTGTYVVYLADAAGNRVSDLVTFTTEPTNPNREVYMGFRHIR